MTDKKVKAGYVAVTTPPHFNFFCDKCDKFFNSRFTQPFATTQRAFGFICGGCYADIMNKTPF
jgi:hypothetical protein